MSDSAVYQPDESNSPASSRPVLLGARIRSVMSGKTAKGSDDAVSDILRQHVPRVYRFAVRLTGDVHIAEDITQETYLKAWKAKHKLRNDEAARVWLFRIAANLWRDQLRKKQVRDKASQTVFDLSCKSSSSPHEDALATDEHERIRYAVEKLPDRQREVLHLTAYEKLSTDSIANILNISNSAVKSNLSLARKNVRAFLAEPVAS